MKNKNALAAGFAGAATTTILHEISRRTFKDSPRLDRLGEQGAQKIVEALGGDVPSKDKLYWPAMAGDLVANGFFYSVAGAGGRHGILRGLALGLAAGLGAVLLPDKLGLNGSYTTATRNRTLATVALYTAGGLVAGWLSQRLHSGRERKPFFGLMTPTVIQQ